MSDQENKRGVLGDLPEPSPDKPKTPLPKLPVLGLDKKLPVIQPRDEDPDSGGGNL
jgi:hypothetical protein